MDRVDTRDVASLLAATDDQGNVDQVVFEAHRLRLHSQRGIGMGIDADGLAIAVRQSPLYRTSDRRRLIATINEHLDSPVEQQRFRASMAKSSGLLRRIMRLVGTEK